MLVATFMPKQLHAGSRDKSPARQAFTKTLFDGSVTDYLLFSEWFAERITIRCPISYGKFL